MAFSISFLDAAPEYPYEDAFTKGARGLIVLAEYSEEFLASLGEWTHTQYREQWARSIQRLIEGDAKAVLITTFSSPDVASHLEWWALYREGEDVFAQNQLLLFDDLTGKFDVSRAVEYLRDRQTVNEEGLPISEWRVSMDDLRVFSRAAS